MKVYRKALPPPDSEPKWLRRPLCNQASRSSCETCALHILLLSRGSPPTDTQVECCDLENAVSLSQLEVLLHVFPFTFAPFTQPKLVHKVESMQALLKVERESTEVMDWIMAPWLEPVATW